MSAKTGTELGSRSVFRVTPDSDLIAKVQDLVESWCQRKGWNSAAISTPGIASVSSGVHGSYVYRAFDQDSSTVARWQFTQQSRNGVWVTTVTVLHRYDKTGIVWTDLHCPVGQKAKPPRLVREMVSTLDGLDGQFALTSQTSIADPSDITRIWSTISDYTRRGLVFVAGSESDKDISISRWEEYVRRLLTRTAGFGSSYILTPEATVEFNRDLPESHRASPWTIRTYYPNPDIRSRTDGLRHRILSIDRIASSDARDIESILENAARIHSTKLRLPDEITLADRRARTLLDEVISDRAAARTSAATPDAVVSPQFTHSTPPAVSPLALRRLPPPSPISPEALDILVDGLTQFVGTHELTVDSIGRLVAIAADGRNNLANLNLLRSRLADVESERNELDDRSNELGSQLEDTQLEYAIIQSDLTQSTNEVRHLRRELSRLDRGDVDWIAPAESIPETFGEILSRFDEHKFVQFTGDSKAMRDLDSIDPHGSWAQRTWLILRALNDYCTLKDDGVFHGSVDDYANSTPTGYTGLTGHKRGETSLTKENRNYGRLRTLPVPPEVNPEGKVFMGAHVVIAQSGMNSPRLHYHNDTHSSGLIYVGYIGKHLRNFRTS